MKNVLFVIFSFVLILSCASNTTIQQNNKEEEPVVIKNDSLEYEITIIDIGFNTYLNSIARPAGYYSQAYLENRNRIYVPLWNARVNNPTRFNPNIYENIIDYNANIDYGYDVNYKLFNYFEFAQQKYRMRLR
ncbi:DUF6146 family protein [Tenacibaculum sp. M341]|uniref:DUF6146 family protein n=1 Tax=Tenacibaculum sp. M341 TaxID=2530339 RepID=UPI001A9DC030|nr:DUF6146 family protein [Tenacibaculum sp. M341]